MKIVIFNHVGEFGGMVQLEIKNVSTACYSANTLQYWTTTGAKFEKELQPCEWFAIYDRD